MHKEFWCVDLLGNLHFQDWEGNVEQGHDRVQRRAVVLRFMILRVSATAMLVFTLLIII
jgi:hypothetical protein